MLILALAANIPVTDGTDKCWRQAESWHSDEFESEYFCS